MGRQALEPLPDVVVSVDNADELFAADPRCLLTGSRRIDSGMDELVDRILAQNKTSSEQRIVLDITSEGFDAETVVGAARRYLELRRGRAAREHDLIWRQGKRSLLSGSFLFAVGIGLSYVFSQPRLGEASLDLLGSGVFLVVAWVGLWYPLDLLFIAREQAKREIKVLGEMISMPIVVRSSGTAAAGAVFPSSAARADGSRTLNVRFRRFRGPSKSGL